MVFAGKSKVLFVFFDKSVPTLLPDTYIGSNLQQPNRCLVTPDGGDCKDIHPGLGIIYPIASMYGIFTYIYHRNQPNAWSPSRHLKPFWKQIMTLIGS